MLLMGGDPDSVDKYQLLNLYEQGRIGFEKDAYLTYLVLAALNRIENILFLTGGGNKNKMHKMPTFNQMFHPEKAEKIKKPSLDDLFDKLEEEYHNGSANT